MINRIFIAFIIICHSATVFAQADSWLWAKNAGENNDECFSVSTDPLGNVFAAGYFSTPTDTFGSTTLTNADVTGLTCDIILAKYDSSGNVLWAKSFGGTDFDQAFSVNADTFGNVFVTGNFRSLTITFGSITLACVGNEDMFIAKFDSNGNVLWAKSSGGTGNDEGWSVSSDPSGNVFATGFFYSTTITFGSIILTNADPTGDSCDIFLAKYDSNGNVLWAKRAGGTSWDKGHSVSADASGNVFLTGYFASHTLIFGSTILTNAGSEDIFLVKFDANGNVIWAKRAGGLAGGERGHSVCADPSGNVFMTGEFASPSITFGSILITNNSGYHSIFIVKYDTNGNALWAKGCGGPGWGNSGCSISADPVGNVFVTGIFFSPTITFGSITLTDPDPGNDSPIFLVEYDAAGNLLCARALAQGGYSWHISVSADPFGSAFIGNSFGMTPFIIGSDTLDVANGTFFIAKYNCLCTPFLTISGDQTICKGEITTLSASGASSYVWLPGSITNDSISVSPLVTTTYSLVATSSTGCIDTTSILVTVSLCTGISLVDDGTNGVSVFPNPSSGKFALETQISQSKIQICNVVGEIVFSGTIKNPTMEIDLTWLANGIYFLNIKSEKNSATQKIIIQK